MPHFLDTYSPYVLTNITLVRGATRFPKKSHRLPPNECQTISFTLDSFKLSKIPPEMCYCFSGKPLELQTRCKQQPISGWKRGSLDVLLTPKTPCMVEEVCWEQVIPTDKRPHTSLYTDDTIFRLHFGGPPGWHGTLCTWAPR
jgi:hypothetical protein